MAWEWVTRNYGIVRLRFRGRRDWATSGTYFIDFIEVVVVGEVI